ncbi:hypothetical protein [Ornithinimicrobium cavernae]|uniref:hypothetical protein n=1 Tax=Ornithinimicrobium cavernae TaxID=2666047 RepID=UPI001F376D3B|nr:hypothetical protein [Ornithinimicrobium cavernae]
MTATPRPPVGRPGSPAPSPEAAPFDPLRLCIFATVALLGWLAGPFALLVFAALGFAGYWRARRAGLTRSQCLLRDTRLVLAYLGLLVLAGGAGIWWQVTS